MTHRLKHVGILLAVFALAMRAAIPLGWMPNVAAHPGAPALIMCFGAAPAATAASASHTHHQAASLASSGPAQDHDGHTDHQGHDAPCPFAGIGFMALDASSAPPLGRSEPIVDRGFVALPVLALAGSQYREQAPRGPPLGHVTRQI